MKVKLIRDRLSPSGPGVTIETVTRPMHVALLIAKLHEESEEIADSHCMNVEEYADVLQVLRDLAALHGIDWRQVAEARAAKARLRGGFLAGRAMIYRLAGEPA